MTISGVSYNLQGSIRHLGLPAAGVSLLLFEYWRLGNGVLRQFVAKQGTNARGEFSFDVAAGTYHMEVVPDSSTRFLRQSLEDIVVAGNTICNISLKTGVILAGTVVTADGATVRECRVLAQGIEPWTYRASERPDQSGKFQLVVPKGRYCLAARHDRSEDSATGESPDRPFIATDVEVLDIDADTRHDIALPPLVRYSGRVVGENGRPVPSTVTITPAINDDNFVLVDLRIKSSSPTDEDGCFELYLQPGLYDVVVQAAASPFAESREKSVLVDSDVSRDFTLAAGHRLFGKVTFEGAPLRGCLVKVHGKDGKAALTAAGPAGDFSLGVPAGAFEVTMSGAPDPSGRLANLTLAPWTSEISLDKDTELAVEIARGITVEGVVEDASGNPRPGVKVSAIHDRGVVKEEGDEPRPVSGGTTGDDGAYSFGLMPGKYLVYLNDDRSNIRSVEVKDEPQRLDFTWTAGYLVRFEVHGEGEEPVPRCKVGFAPYSQVEPLAKFRKANRDTVVEGSSFTNDDGVCRITLPAGVYSFSFSPPAQGSYQSKTLRQLSIGSDLKRRVTLSVKRAEDDADPADALPEGLSADGSSADDAQPAQLTLQIAED